MRQSRRIRNGYFRLLVETFIENIHYLIIYYQLENKIWILKGRI